MNAIEVDASNPKEAVIVMRRTLDAPRELVWKALTEPAHVKQWYGGHGFSNPRCDMDVRPGGLWTHVMRTPDGQEFEMQFVFVEVVKPERLVWKSAPGKGPTGGPHDNVITVTLEAAGNRTRWKCVTTFKSMADREAALQIRFTEVLGQGVEKLTDVLRTMTKS